MAKQEMLKRARNNIEEMSIKIEKNRKEQQDIDTCVAGYVCPNCGGDLCDVELPQLEGGLRQMPRVSCKCGCMYYKIEIDEKWR